MFQEMVWIHVEYESMSTCVEGENSTNVLVENFALTYTGECIPSKIDHLAHSIFYVAYVTFYSDGNIQVDFG